MFAKKVTSSEGKGSGDLVIHLSPIPYPLSPIPYSTSKGVMEEQRIKGRDLYDTYFVTSEENHELHKCRECSRNIKQNVKKGYTNLVVHVTTQHKDEYVEKVRAHIGVAVAGAMDTFVRRSSEKAKNIFGWMEWIVMENLALQSCENRNFRKRTNLSCMTSKTLKKYMIILFN